MSRFSLHNLCLLLFGVALSSAQFPWAAQNPQTPHGSSPFPTSPFGPSQFPTSPFGSSQFPTSPFGSSQFPTSPFGSSQFPTSPFGSSQSLDSFFGSGQHPASIYGAGSILSPHLGFPALSGFGQQSAGFGYPQMSSQFGGNSMMTSLQTPWSHGAASQPGFGSMNGDTRNVGGDTGGYGTRTLSPFGFPFGGTQSFGSSPSLFSQLNQLQDANKNGIPDHLEMTKSKIDDYLAKLQQLGNRRLSVQVDYLNTPLEYQFLNQYHGIQHPLAGTSLGDYFNVPRPKPVEQPQYQSQPQYQPPQYQTQPPPQYQPPNAQPFPQSAVRAGNSTVTP